MEEQLDRVRRAYDLTVEQYRKGINPYISVPEDIRNTDFFQSLYREDNLNSASSDIRKYLSPETGMKFLDAGCSANLANYNLGEWPSVYYGVDISPALIKAMKEYAAAGNIPVGGLYVADISAMPFNDDFFDIAAVIGVLEYCTLEYISLSLRELHRVMKPESRVVLDIPNTGHPYASDMQRLEEYLQRPIFLHPRPEFEKLLTSVFSIDIIDDSKVMLRYFIRTVK
jgi:ubiquinone/menaquinone biosynthesis C-methylase UbiE